MRTSAPASRQRSTDLSGVLKNDLEAGLKELGLGSSVEQRASLLTFLELLIRWNRTYNLTSVRDPHDMLAVHLLDSLSVTELVSSTRPTSVLDVGTGPGFPGIPLAILLPRVRFELVDAVAKKIGFLQQAKAALGLRNVFVHHERVEALTLPHMPSLIISRAYAEIGQMLRSVDRLAGSDTVVVAMKGAIPHAELATLPEGWQVAAVQQLDVPMLGAQRCAVVLRRALTEVPT